MIVRERCQSIGYVLVQWSYLEDDEEASLGEGAAVDGHALAGDDLDVVMLGDVAGRRLDLGVSVNSQRSNVSSSNFIDRKTSFWEIFLLFFMIKRMGIVP
jgi:hypothetical protein